MTCLLEARPVRKGVRSIAPGLEGSGVGPDYDSAVAHQLPSSWESRYFFQFRHNRHCCYLNELILGGSVVRVWIASLDSISLGSCEYDRPCHWWS